MSDSFTDWITIMTSIADEATDNEIANTPDEVSEVDTPTEAETPAANSDAGLDEFWSIVDSINAEAPDFKPAVDKYDTLSRGNKMSVTHAIKARVMTALDEDNFTLGKLLSGLSKAVVASTGGTADADPTEELVQRMGGIYLAYTRLKERNPNLSERVSAVVEASKDPDADTIANSLAKRLIETKMGRKQREGGGTRHNVGKHIAQVFENVSDGTTLSVDQLVEAKSAEYGDDAVSKVSVTQHLKSSFDQPGLSVVRDGDKIVGVRKGEQPEA